MSKSIAPVQASVDVSAIRQQFNFDWTTSEPIEDLDTYWWWARSIRVDPYEVIADDDEGGLWSIPFTTDGKSEVTFGEPVKVYDAYIPVAASDGVAATAVVSKRRQKVAAAALDRPDKPKRVSAQSSDEPTRADAQEGDMDGIKLRERIGLAADATDEQVDQRLAQLPAAGDEAAEEAPAAPAEAQEPVAASAPETVTVSKAVFDAMASDLESLKASDEARTATEQKTHRDGLVASALDSGRISKFEAEDWRKALDDAPAATESLLTSLTPGRVPVSERGHGKGNDNPQADAFEADRRARLGGAKKEA